MMGRQIVDQSQLFYEFRLDDVVPDDHLVRDISADGCQRELEPSSARSAQSQSTEPQDTFQVTEQHFNAFAIAARLLEGVGLGEHTGHIAGLLSRLLEPQFSPDFYNKICQILTHAPQQITRARRGEWIMAFSRRRGSKRHSNLDR